MQRNVHLKARLVPHVYLSLTDSSKLLICLSICCLAATLETTYWHKGLWSYHIKKPLGSVKMAFIIRRLTSSSAASWGPEASSSILLWGGEKRRHTEREGLKQQQKNHIPNTLRYGPQKKIMQNSPQWETIPLFCVYLWWCFYTLRKNCCEAYKFIRQTHVLLVPLKVTASYGAFLSF